VHGQFGGISDAIDIRVHDLEIWFLWLARLCRKREYATGQGM
jgi:hypothetical protein